VCDVTASSTDSLDSLTFFLFLFLGVPYAASPSGKLRFMPPVTPDLWSGIRTADRTGSVCPQTLTPTPSPSLLHRFRSTSLPLSLNQKQTLEELFKNETELLKILTPTTAHNHLKMRALLQNQSEDCLYLNIYVPVSGEFSSLSSHTFILSFHPNTNG